MDSLLSRAFIETPTYRALTTTHDYNFLVGRRGTGKTALFQKVREHYKGVPGTIVLSDVPPEHYTIELQSLLLVISEQYRTARAISRLLWRIHLLFEALRHLQRHYKTTKALTSTSVLTYLNQHKQVLAESGIARCVTILRDVARTSSSAADLLSTLPRIMAIETLQQTVKNAIDEAGLRVIVLFDGLDDGWLPEPIPTAVLGGLALASADLVDSHSGIYPLIFIRDNIFRALAQMDGDFTRHIEGHTLRLH